MEKIKMATPLVEMDGDEMTRILWQIIKDSSHVYATGKNRSRSQDMLMVMYTKVWR